MILVIEPRKNMLQNKNIMHLTDTTNDKIQLQTQRLLADAAVYDLREKAKLHIA